MFCTNCGFTIKEEEKFCTGCGKSKISNSVNTSIDSTIIKNEKWWHRLMRVFYIISYLPLLGIIPLVWDENKPYCSYYSSSCYGSYWESFFYSLLTFVIYIVVLRLIKIAVVYIVYGIKPKFKKEFKKFY